MIVDFHTHIFPDDLSKRAMDTLFGKCCGLYSPVHDGTANGLLKNMDDWNIDISVIQPVITKPSQLKKANEWAAALCSDRIVSFGGIFPHTEDYKRDIDFVVGLGLKGLKFHPEYQNFLVDDNHMLKIYDYALEKGLILLFHAGYDIGHTPPYKSSPGQFANIVNTMGGGTIVAAHLGGGGQWDDVETHLAGKNIYFDTSMGFEYYPAEQFLRILKAHGAEKILFASDAPWSSAKTEMERLMALPLSKRDIDGILGGNAKRILKVERE